MAEGLSDRVQNLRNEVRSEINDRHSGIVDRAYKAGDEVVDAYNGLLRDISRYIGKGDVIDKIEEARRSLGGDKVEEKNGGRVSRGPRYVTTGEVVSMWMEHDEKKLGKESMPTRSAYSQRIGALIKKKDLVIERTDSPRKNYVNKALARKMIKHW